MIFQVVVNLNLRVEFLVNSQQANLSYLITDSDLVNKNTMANL